MDSPVLLLELSYSGESIMPFGVIGDDMCGLVVLDKSLF